MANSTSSGSKAKANENNNGRRVGETNPINSGSSTKDATGARRSMRATSSNSMTPSPSSTRKSERLGNSTSSPLVRRTSERVEKQSTPSPLRRSKRNQSDISPSSRSVDSTVSKKKKKKHKSVKKITYEAEKTETKEHDGETSQVKRRRLDARSFLGLIKTKPKTGRLLKNVIIIFISFYKIFHSSSFNFVVLFSTIFIACSCKWSERVWCEKGCFCTL